MTHDLFSILCSGTFEFERQVSSSYPTIPGVIIKGTAQFSPLSPNGASFEEKGTYVLNELTYDCSQRQIYTWIEETLTIQKGDGYSLHTFDFSGNKGFPLEATHLHPCRDDTYSLLITILSPDQWITFYKIYGPTKQYTITTTFKRLHPWVM